MIKMDAKEVISNSLRIAWKDLMELFRDRLRLALMILMPLLMMAMIGFIYPSGNTAALNNLPIGLVNQDSGFHNVTLPSQDLITGLQQMNNQTHMFKFTYLANMVEIKADIQSGQINGGIIIPSNFSLCIACGEQGTVMIVIDQSNPTISQELQATVSAELSQMSTLLAQQKVQELSPGITASDSVAIIQPYIVKMTGVVSGNLSYFNFVAPGMIMMTLMTSVMTGLPGAISREKEVGTLDGIMVAPINRSSIVTGKALSQTIRGLFQAFIILALAIGLFGVVINGSFILVTALMFLEVFSFVGLGIVLTSIAKDQETAQMLMMTLVFPMMFLSGVFFPIQQMPWFMQDISKIFPLTYAVDALRRVMVLGAGASAISTDIIVMIVFGSVMLAVAVPLFKRMMAR